MGSLLDRDDCVLIVVDAQPGFAIDGTAAARAAEAAEPSGTESDTVIARISWMAGVAVALGIPVVVTEEDPAANGPTAAPIVARLSAAGQEPATFVKPVFGLAAVPEIMAAIEATGRRTAVLVGYETDVCVAQSALGLRDAGYRVAVVVDATGSPGAMHTHGLERMRAAGVIAVHAKGVYYEWVRTLATARAFEAAHPDLVSPPGFRL
jgi:nicotinamidase-related amidase